MTEQKDIDSVLTKMGNLPRGGSSLFVFDRFIFISLSKKKTRNALFPFDNYSKNST